MRVLTGVKPTGQPHIGNYLGAIQPALQLAKESEDSLLFIADYHSLTGVTNPKDQYEWTYDVAATWLACGLDPEKTVFYRQSDVPEIFEMTWILSCQTPKGLMNRAHAYKAKVQENEEAGKKELDYGVNMGLYSYPILMASDIITFGANKVPVGEDQVQHIEIARDIVQKFNHTYGETLVVPEFFVQDHVKTVPGLDGQKMSKSYNNYIPLFAPTKKLRKMIMKIKTDSSAPEDPKDPNDSIIFDLYKCFANSNQIEELKRRYEEGIGWGEAKQALYEVIDAHIEGPRAIYDDLMNNREKIDLLLAEGASKARKMAQETLQNVRQAIGRNQ